MASESVCPYNKYGHCKHGVTCRYQHVNQKCENSNCDVSKCVQRHPRECRFYRDYSRCKFGEYCSFEHAVKNDATKTELETLKTKLANLESKNSEMNYTVQRLTEKQKELENNLNEKDKKIEDINHQLKNVLNAFNDTIQQTIVSALAPLTLRQSDIEQNSNTQFKTLETQLNTLLDVLKHAEPTSSTSTESPVFMPTSSHPVPPSASRKPQDQVKHPCNFCGQKFETERAMKNHIRNYHEASLT